MVECIGVTWHYGGFVLDLEPRGPLPTEIYWRRRGLALGIAVVVVGILIAIGVAFVSGGSGAKGGPAAKPSGAQAKSSGAQASPPSGAPAPGQPGPPADGSAASPAQNPEAATPTAAVFPPPILKEGDDCPDSTLAVKGLTNLPQYYIGDQPKFTMVVTNIGLVACKRDVGAAALAAYVYSLDNKRLWSNLDCAPSNETLIKSFAPGEQVTTAVTWTGMGSAPHCPLPRPAIGPGTYNLVIQLGNLRSQPVPFILNVPPPPPGPVPPGGAPVPGMPAPPEAPAAPVPPAGG